MFDVDVDLRIEDIYREKVCRYQLSLFEFIDLIRNCRTY